MSTNLAGLILMNICIDLFQAERLSEFYEICKSFDIGRGERFIKIEQVGCLTCVSLLLFGFFVTFQVGVLLN